MGDYYDFKCEKCDFKTRCSNGKDRGLLLLSSRFIVQNVKF